MSEANNGGSAQNIRAPADPGGVRETVPPNPAAAARGNRPSLPPKRGGVMRNIIADLSGAASCNAPPA